MYEEFASIYDRMMEDVNYQHFLKRLESGLVAMLKKPLSVSHLLEVGCGTGRATAYFADRAASIFAVDPSSSMLSYAWSRLAEYNNVTFSCQYGQSMEVPSCDAAFSLFDTMNYILSIEELEETFRRVAQALPRGGVFLFDLNGGKRLLEDFQQDWIYDTEAVFYTWQNESEGDVVHSLLTFFVKQEDGSYQRLNEEQTQRYYPLSTIEEILCRAGFSTILFSDFEQEEEKWMDLAESSSKKLQENIQRVLICARKL